MQAALTERCWYIAIGKILGVAGAAVWMMLKRSSIKRAKTIVNLSHLGRGGPDNAALISTGTENISFANGLSTVGLGDITSFNFNLEETTNNSVTFGLAGLTSLSASVGPGLTRTSLAIETRAVQDTGQGTHPREFATSSLGPGDATTLYEFIGF